MARMLLKKVDMCYRFWYRQQLMSLRGLVSLIDLRFDNDFDLILRWQSKSDIQ
jgi:hypothetical protein